MKDFEFLRACAEIDDALKNQNQEKADHNFGINGGNWDGPCGGGAGGCPYYETPGSNGDTNIL